MSFSRFPSIEQFRHVVKEISFKTKGKKTKPILTFLGTVKLHGTNAGIGYKDGQEVWAQSRSRLLSKDTQDNQGFRAYVEEHSESLKSLCQKVDHTENETVFLYGEWIGKGIQRGVAVCKLSKRFVIFSAKVVDGEQERWIDPECLKELKDEEGGVYNIFHCCTWTVDIDFNDPSASQEYLEKITDQVEIECPFGKKYGEIGIGEGVVWSSFTPEFGMVRFKVKGEKHRVTKTKNTASCDITVCAGEKEFVDKTVTQNRLQQGVLDIFGQECLDMRKTNQFLEWMVHDILKEEGDVVLESKLCQKSIDKLIRHVSRDWLLKKRVKLHSLD